MHVDSPSRRRRHRTRQRERMLAWLRATDRHPTAADVHAALLPEFPRLSLGTVYRNLEVLVSERQVVPVPTEGGVMRYDGNPRPHHHFFCERCGRIEDVEIALPDELAARLRHEHGLEARRLRVYGLCGGCRRGAAACE